MFVQYAKEHPRREQALSAWHYLESLYSRDSLFAVHHKPMHAIEREMSRKRAEDSTFLANLDPESYVSWFLPVRRLVSSVSVVAQHRPDSKLISNYPIIFPDPK